MLWLIHRNTVPAVWQADGKEIESFRLQHTPSKAAHCKYCLINRALGEKSSLCTRTITGSGWAAVTGLVRTTSWSFYGRANVIFWETPSQLKPTVSLWDNPMPRHFRISDVQEKEKKNVRVSGDRTSRQTRFRIPRTFCVSSGISKYTCMTSRWRRGSHTSSGLILNSVSEMAFISMQSELLQRVTQLDKTLSFKGGGNLRKLF